MFFLHHLPVAFQSVRFSSGELLKMKVLVQIILALGAVTALPRLPNSLPKKIVGGSEASKGEFPHMVLIKLGSSDWCGGSIVNEHWIVTAANCASAPITGYTLVAGQHDLSEEEGSEQSRKVVEIIIHPDHNKDSSIQYNSYNIAVMRADEPFKFNVNVGPATIPNPAFTPGNKLVAAGWGTLSSEGPHPDILMKVSLPFVSYQNCWEAWGDDVTETMICAGEAGHDTCLGDAGGPLMSGNTLAGITSWGSVPCALEGKPGVYTSVAYFSNWIRDNTA